jgi:Glucose-6-phosphate dehydrogenase, C-terminal domain
MRDEKVKVLKAIPPIAEKNLVRGQFHGYRDEKGVAKGSQVETFAALRLEINSWRWKGVPFGIATDHGGYWLKEGLWFSTSKLPNRQRSRRFWHYGRPRLI